MFIVLTMGTMSQPFKKSSLKRVFTLKTCHGTPNLIKLGDKNLILSAKVIILRIKVNIYIERDRIKC